MPPCPTLPRGFAAVLLPALLLVAGGPVAAQSNGNERQAAQATTSAPTRGDAIEIDQRARNARRTQAMTSAMIVPPQGGPTERKISQQPTSGDRWGRLK